MIAAFIHFDDRTILILGLSTKDLLMLSMFEEPPPMNLEKMAEKMGCSPATMLQIITGPNDDAIEARIKAAMGPGVEEIASLDQNQMREVMGLEPTSEDLAAVEAEEAAISRAKNARFN